MALNYSSKIISYKHTHVHTIHPLNSSTNLSSVETAVNETKTMFPKPDVQI